MKVRMRRAEIAGKFVESVTPSKCTGWNVKHAVFGIEFVDCRTAARCVPLAKDLLKVAMKKFVDSVMHNLTAFMRSSLESLQRPFAGACPIKKAEPQLALQFSD